MSRLGTAFRSFFAALGSSDAADRLSAAIGDQTPRLDAAEATVGSGSTEEPVPIPQPEERPVRSDAVTLLAALQREGRLIDFLQEPIEQFSDEQVGAAVRDVHRGCRQTLDRLLPVSPLVDAAEGTAVSLSTYPRGYVRSIGGQAESGSLLHPGWKVAEVKLPDYTGPKDEANIIMPAEIEAA